MQSLHSRNQSISKANVQAHIDEITANISKEYGQQCAYEKDHALNIKRAGSKVIYIDGYPRAFVLSQIKDMLFISSSF